LFYTDGQTDGETDMTKLSHFSQFYECAQKYGASIRPSIMFRILIDYWTL